MAPQARRPRHGAPMHGALVQGAPHAQWVMHSASYNIYELKIGIVSLRQPILTDASVFIGNCLLYL